jgi:hypothetical protein
MPENHAILSETLGECPQLGALCQEGLCHWQQLSMFYRFYPSHGIDQGPVKITGPFYI